MLCIIPFPQAGKADFEFLEKKAIEWGEPKVPSGKQVNISHLFDVLLRFGINNNRVLLCLYSLQELVEMIFHSAL